MQDIPLLSDETESDVPTRHDELSDAMISSTRTTPAGSTEQVTNSRQKEVAPASRKSKRLMSGRVKTMVAVSVPWRGSQAAAIVRGRTKLSTTSKCTDIFQDHDEDDEEALPVKSRPFKTEITAAVEEGNRTAANEVQARIKPELKTEHLGMIDLTLDDGDEQEPAQARSESASSSAPDYVPEAQEESLEDLEYKLEGVLRRKRMLECEEEAAMIKREIAKRRKKGTNRV